MRKTVTLWLDEALIEAIEDTRGTISFDDRLNYLLRIGLLAEEQERRVMEANRRMIIGSRKRAKRPRRDP
jgi:hypothetical protein